MDIAPPPQFSHVYRGSLTERRGTLAEVEYFCHTLHGIVSAYRALGCAKVRADSCFIMVPKVGGKITARFQAAIRQHELAHCNGWAGSHPRH
jgi:hypothetical protein